MLLIGDFVQLPSSGWMIFEHSTPSGAWNLFKLREITEIVRENNDPEIVELLNKVCVGEQNQSGIAAINAIADTDISE